MFEIWKWLESDKDYFKGIELMDKYCPTHSMLAGLKAGNMSIVNRAYLEHILKDTLTKLKPTKKPKVEPAQKKTKQPKQAVKQLTHDDFKRIADKELATAYSDRRRFSNQFHFCKTDEERANLSDEIQEVIQDINDLKSRINVYKSTKKMPPKIEVKGFEIPKTDVDLLKKRNNYRAKVSTQKKLILDYESKERKMTKAEHELRLSQLENKLKILDDEKQRRDH